MCTGTCASTGSVLAIWSPAKPHTVRPIVIVLAAALPLCLRMKLMLQGHFTIPSSRKVSKLSFFFDAAAVHHVRQPNSNHQLFLRQEIAHFERRGKGGCKQSIVLPSHAPHSRGGIFETLTRWARSCWTMQVSFAL